MLGKSLSLTQETFTHARRVSDISMSRAVNLKEAQHDLFFPRTEPGTGIR